MTVTAEQEAAIRLIEKASSPADLFGEDDPRQAYGKLAKLTHPDVIRDPRAEAAFKKLSLLWSRRGIAAGLFSRGDIADLYADGDLLIKYPRAPADNDLMAREVTALRQARIRLTGRDEHGLAFFPRLERTQRQRDPGTGKVRQVNTLRLLDGFRTLEEVQAAYPDGIHPRDAAWMWRRLLTAIGYAHKAGLVHGAVLPQHILIHPGGHGLVLADWCYSQASPGGSGRLPAMVTRYEDWYPPGTRTASWGPGGDIWLSARCMITVMGDAAVPQMTSFARGCMLARADRQPDDAWQLLAELDDLLGRLFGPRKFHTFTMPAREPSC